MLKVLISIIISVVAVALLYLLAIMPKLRKNPDFRRFEGWLYAHRGYHNNKSEAPENSLPAFKRAVKRGYGIELDVQLTKDKVPVVFHDFDMQRACGVDKKIADLKYEELKKYKLFRSHETIPTFHEVLNCIGGKVPLIIELKIKGNPSETCLAAAKELGKYKGIYCIESFNPLVLIWYRKHFPNIIRGQLSTDYIKDNMECTKMQNFLLKNLMLNFLTKPDFIAYHHIYKNVWSFVICRKLYRIKTVAWTIKSQEELDDNKDYFDLFIFDKFAPRV